MISTENCASAPRRDILAGPAGISSGLAVDAVAGVTDALRAYERGLNAGDSDAVMTLYAPDGVFMAQHFPPAVGTDRVRKAYDGVFATIRLAVSFDIVEVVPVAEDWAFARTNSTGMVTVLAGGRIAPEANQELFVFQRIDGAWKIARYTFSTVNPPRG